MKRTVGLGSLICVCFVLAGVAFAAKEHDQNDKAKAALPKALCPVMHQPIDKSVWIDYRGGKLYFCCQSCVKKFKAHEAKYAAGANLQLVVTGQAQQVACPITGKTIDPQHALKVGGVTVKFCCGVCEKKVAKAGAEEQIKMVFGTGFNKGFAVKKNEKNKKN